MFDAYAFSADNEIYVLNAEACKYMNEEAAQQPGNDYEWGQKADAIANWLNRQGKEDAETRAGLADFTRGVTRAGGSPTISDLMSAQTMEFVFDYAYPDLGSKKVYTAYSSLKVLYTVYSAYDFGGNVEYYQVRQHIIAMNDRIHYAANDVWYMRSNDGTYNLTRGAWMKSIDTKMWLEGAGTKTIMSAGPLNENGTSSGYTSQGGSNTITTGHTNGLSVGLSGGISGDMASLLLNGNYTHTWTYSESNATTWETATNWSTKDLGGRLVFGLKEDGVEELTDSIALDLNINYNVGETIIKNVNGYDLTFEVTKKNQEVKLSSVPKDFQGELAIPKE